MANFSVSSVRINGIFSCLPQRKHENSTNPLLENSAAFVAHTGIKYTYEANEDHQLLAYFLKAAQTGLDALQWSASDLNLIVCVSQTPDQAIPSCANQLHAALKGADHCMCFDINQGCSGYVYGLAVVGQFLEKMPGAKALLCVGDFSSRLTSKTDPSTRPVFSDAVSVSLCSNYPSSPKMHFSLGSIAKGVNAIHMKNTAQNEQKMALSGIDVFALSVQNVPIQLNTLLDKYPQYKTEQTQLVLHQANQLINLAIIKKLVTNLQILQSIEQFGNTSSASIPLTICLNSERIKAHSKFCLSGFGVGFSVASVLLELDPSCQFSIQTYEAF